ncbi:MAG: flagellin FliC [Magnetococcales bacterium]|nr:flagellin FliC [Magnetococcales bacterium]MBF0308520.1 flagellin FliC [Magnetococcales bacterium]
MAFVINTNIAALLAQRNLSDSTRMLGQSFKRLSTGLRVQSAQDDAGGLSIATRLSSRIRGLNQALRNANDGISLTQVADGALEETTNALQRMRELAVQASNGSYTTSDRANIQLEVSALIDEIDRIASKTEFNNQFPLMGSVLNMRLQVGAASGDYLSVTIASATKSGIGIPLVSVGGTSAAPANSAITVIDAAIDSVSSIRAYLGAMQTRLESVVANLTNTSDNMTQAHSRIVDADMAKETSVMTRNAILQQAGVAVLAQANQQPALLMDLLK